ncbi:hypothetical protein PFDG_03634, partial [Plasmodium falciparum Dd2]
NLSTEENKKYVYAKYKTIYLKKCFDNNITPEPGSPKNEDAVSEVDNKIDDEDKEEEEQITNDKYEHYEENNNDYYKGREKIGTQSKGTEDSVDFNLSLKHAQYAVNGIIKIIYIPRYSETRAQIIPFIFRIIFFFNGEEETKNIGYII